MFAFAQKTDSTSTGASKKDYHIRSSSKTVKTKFISPIIKNDTNKEISPPVTIKTKEKRGNTRRKKQ